LLDEFMNIVGVDALNSHREWFPTRAAEYGEGLRSFLEASMVISATDYAGAQMLARKFQGGFAHLLLEIDLLLCPSWATPAQPVGPDGNLSLEVDSGLLLKFTAPFNASGNPTLSVPCGFTKDGLPLSLQLVGRHFEEALLLRAGHVYEQSCDWISHVPNLEEA
jgi:amidase